MAKYRRLPIVVEAVQFDMCAEPYPAGVEERRLDGEPTKMRGSRVEFFIKTLEGEHIVTDGDWIITGVHGEKHAVKPDKFPLLYEPA